MVTRAHGTARDIARVAIRARLTEVAIDLFRRDGFDRVTVNDVAEAAGVSRSTFLRYFGTKEEAVLSTSDEHEAEVAEALRKRPATEDDWTALRRSLDPVLRHYGHDPATALLLAQLIAETPALRARNLERQANLRPVLAAIVAERSGAPSDAIRPAVLAATALICLSIAVDQWTASKGERDLPGLLDQAFATLAHS
ncbi:acyl-CoA-like ligand-binding transcription factor [Actinoplanes sp. RD1]|uniref:acyl-CoA-like ligand-binding transcription factor n=1 Tax=Actinoplanes sp. RD1 TaxID=3064538 RepID=UPI0027406C10|nr:TetR family transcriptional regulator [Actinoplanes sp. RD1]